MTEMRDPNEIWRECQANLPERREDGPPRLQRVEVRPYPDLARLWVRFETTEFKAGPNVALTVSDAAGRIVSTMLVVELHQSYLSLTMHLRQAQAPGAVYTLHVELSREELELDHRDVDFVLAFDEPA